MRRQKRRSVPNREACNKIPNGDILKKDTIGVVKPAIKSEFVDSTQRHHRCSGKVTVREFFASRHWARLFLFAGREKMADVENADDYGADRKPITLYLAIFYCFKFIRG